MNNTLNILTATGVPPVGKMELWNYTANAYITQESVNPVVYRGDSVDRVYITNSHDIGNGCLLSESLAGVVNTDSATDAANEYSTITNLTISEGGKIYSGKHNPLTLPAPDNNSSSVKAVEVTMEQNGLVYLGYGWTQLTYSDSSYNDDTLIAPVDNTSTKTDVAGNTVLTGFAVGTDAVGWADK